MPAEAGAGGRAGSAAGKLGRSCSHGRLEKGKDKMWFVLEQTSQKSCTAEVLAGFKLKTFKHMRFKATGSRSLRERHTELGGESRTHHGERKEKVVKCQDSKKANRRREQH